MNVLHWRGSAVAWIDSIMSRAVFEILVCKGPECAGKRGADRVYQVLCAALDERALHGRVQPGRKNCFGRCRSGPNVYVHPLRSQAPEHSERRPSVPSALYHWVSPADVDEILETHVESGRVVTRLVDPPERAASDSSTHELESD